VALISSRSPSASKDDAASAQPALGCAEGLMVRTPGAASISTSSASPATSSSGLARRIPLELPIFTSFARTTVTPCRRAHIVATLGTSAHAPALANSLLNGSENQRLPTWPFREPFSVLCPYARGIQRCYALQGNFPSLMALVHGSANHLLAWLHQICRAAHPEGATVEHMGSDHGGASA